MRKLALVAIMSTLSATSAFALEAKVTKPSTASAKAVWAAVGDFCNIQKWHAAVEKCEISKKDGATFRTLSLNGGGTILEKLVAWDDAGMSYTYTIEEGPLPVANYKSTLKVVPADKGATVDWSGTFDAKGAPDADAVKTITGVYQAGVDVLAATK